MMKNRKKGGAAVVLVSILCFVLVSLCSMLLITSLTMRHCAVNKALPKAVAEVPLAELTVDGRTAAEIVYEDFVADERVSIENVERVMEEGTFSAYAESLASEYNRYLLEGGEFPQLNADELVALIDENADLIYQETGLQFLAPDKQKLRDSLNSTLPAYNQMLEKNLHQGVSGFAVRSGFSLWLPIVEGAVLLLLLIWMVVLYIRRQRRVGTALVIYGIAAFIPCVLMLIGALLCTPLLKSLTTDIAADFSVPFTAAAIAYTAVGTLAAMLILVTGVLCNSLMKKPAAAALNAAEAPAAVSAAEEKPEMPAAEKIPAETSGVTEALPEVPAAEKTEPEAPAAETPAEPAAASEPEKSEEPEMKRRFCRNCGQPLVNPDAKFCYKCGNIQEHVQPKEDAAAE